MQWLIDILLELLPTLTGFQDRGDPAAFDFVKTDFTRDDSWHDLDLSGVVPSGATAVVLRIALVNTSAGAYIYLRKKGHTNAVNQAECHMQVANVGVVYDKTVAVDENGFCQYRVDPNLWTWLSIVIAGWFGPES